VACGGSGAALSPVAGATGHVMALKLSEPGGESWSHGARDSSGAALSQVVGAGATGHVAAPELP
jgi:hypothetical protein